MSFVSCLYYASLFLKSQEQKGNKLAQNDLIFPFCDPLFLYDADNTGNKAITVT